MRILIVKLSSLGDVVHTMPVIHDLKFAFPGIKIGWAVEPLFAPLVEKVMGVDGVIPIPLRRFKHAWKDWSSFKSLMCSVKLLRDERYDGVLDLQGLTKSAIFAACARGPTIAMGNATEGSSYEAPTKWFAKTVVNLQTHLHAVERARLVAAKGLGYRFRGPPVYGLRATLPQSGQPHASEPGGKSTIVFLHSTSREDKLWLEANWVALGKQFIADGWNVALPSGTDAESARAVRIAAQLGGGASVWPSLALGELVDRLATCQGSIGVDSGLSHVAVALDLLHVQIYNFPTAWRTGPSTGHANLRQESVQGCPVPTLAAVLAAWDSVAGQH